MSRLRNNFVKSYKSRLYKKILEGVLKKKRRTKLNNSKSDLIFSKVVKPPKEVVSFIKIF